MVGVLGHSDSGEMLSPQPGLGDIDALLSRSRASGLEVVATVERTGQRLPEALDLSAYRILQEAVTNILKHAPHAHAEIHVRVNDREVELEVLDDGDGRVAPAADNGGRGLVGMRERVALFHGRLEAGAQNGGGFRVHAILPLGVVQCASGCSSPMTRRWFALVFA